MKTIIYGDSLAGNYGIAPLKAWSQIIAEEDSSNSIKVVFRNGFTTSDLLEGLSRDVLAHLPDRVYFICGTNDALKMKNVTTIVERIRFMAAEITRSGAEPIYLIPPQLDVKEVSRCYGDPPAQVEASDKIISELRSVIRDNLSGFKVIDLEGVRQDYLHLNLANNMKAYCDGIHFLASFQQYLAGRIMDKI